MPSTSPAAADDPLFCDDGLAHCSDYLLVCQAKSTSLTRGSWHFALESADGTPVFEAGDEEIGDLNRLTLLAAVRGLESIDGASAVTLLSNNRYLIRSLSDSLHRWRENEFVWEHFGRRIDVQHADLWRRVDRALSIHRVEACLVSSRLVSRGSRPTPGTRPERGQPAVGFPSPGRESRSNGRGSGSIVRVDSPHRAPKGPKQRASIEPQDQLRRWLLGGGASSPPVTPPRRRFTSADLMETA